MTDKGDTIGVVRDHRWMRAAEQKRHLQELNRVTITIGDSTGRNHYGGYALEDLIRLTRSGTVIQLMYAFLLANPTRKRVKGGLRGEFERVLKLLEKRGGIVRDVLTGLSTETKDKRRALILSVSDQIRRSSQGRSSEENGKRSKGRPRAWGDPAHRQIIWDEWHSNAHATNRAAAEEASRKMGKRISDIVMWRIIKQMREERGQKGLGASGRRPHSTAAALAARLGAPNENRPLPKARVPRGVVYFVKNGVRDRVKIGFSEGHKTRLGALQNASPDELSLIGTIPGTIKTERKMHKRFAEYREKGEWFRIEGTLAKFLKATFTKTKRT